MTKMTMMTEQIPDLSHLLTQKTKTHNNDTNSKKKLTTTQNNPKEKSQ